MCNKFFINIVLGCLIVSLASFNVLSAQNIDSIRLKQLMVRDSLDFINKSLSINTLNNEFSPMPFKGGLMYISNKPIKEAKVAFNKIYWTKDPNFNIIMKNKLKLIVAVQ